MKLSKLVSAAKLRGTTTLVEGHLASKRHLVVEELRSNAKLLYSTQEVHTTPFVGAAPLSMVMVSAVVGWIPTVSSSISLVAPALTASAIA